MEFEFSGEVWHWRGPAPYFFVSLPAEQAEVIADMAGQLTYGWGMIPVHARIGDTRFKTAMFAKDGGYVLPLKVAVRRAERVDEGDVITVRLKISP